RQGRQRYEDAADGPRRGPEAVPDRLPRRLHARADGPASGGRREDRAEGARTEAEAQGLDLPRGDEPAALRPRLRQAPARRLPVPGDLRLHGPHDLGAALEAPAAGLPAQLVAAEPRLRAL